MVPIRRSVSSDHRTLCRRQGHGNLRAVIQQICCKRYKVVRDLQPPLRLPPARTDPAALARERAQLDSRVRLRCQRIAPVPVRTRVVGGLYAGLCGGSLFAVTRILTGGHASLSTSVVIGLLLGAFCVLVWPDRARDCVRADLDQAGIGFPAYRATVRSEDNTVVVALVGAQLPTYRGVLLDTPEGWTVDCDRFHANEDAEATERVAEFRVQAERLRAVGRSRFDALYQLSKSGREDSWTFPAAPVTRWTPRRSQTNTASRPLGCGDWLTAIAQESTQLPERAVIDCRGPTDVAQRARACHKANLVAGAATVLCGTCGSLGAPFRGPIDAALLGVAFLAALLVGFVLIFVVFEIGGLGYCYATHEYDRDELDRPGYGFPQYSVEVRPDECESVIELVGRQEHVSHGMLRGQDRWEVVMRRFPADADDEATEFAALLRAQADQLTEKARDAFLERYSDFEAGATEREDARLVAQALA